MAVADVLQVLFKKLKAENKEIHCILKLGISPQKIEEESKSHEQELHYTYVPTMPT